MSVVATVAHLSYCWALVVELKAESPCTLQWAPPIVKYRDFLPWAVLIGRPFPNNCPFPWGIWTPSNTWFLGSIWAHNPKGISIGSAVRARPQSVPILYNGMPFPSQNCLSGGGSGPSSNTLSLGPPESSTRTASRSVQLFLQGSLVWQTDRQTDRPRYSVGNSRSHLRTYCCDAA